MPGGSGRAVRAYPRTEAGVLNDKRLLDTLRVLRHTSTLCDVPSRGKPRTARPVVLISSRLVTNSGRCFPAVRQVIRHQPGLPCLPWDADLSDQEAAPVRPPRRPVNCQGRRLGDELVGLARESA